VIKTYYYNYEDDSMYHDVDLENIDQLLENPGSLLWIDLYDCSAEELHYVGDLLKKPYFMINKVLTN